MKKITKDNFYLSTVATFKVCKTPTREPDYISESGSQYWYYKDKVVRYADHWGDIASCRWDIREFTSKVWAIWEKYDKSSIDFYKKVFKKNYKQRIMENRHVVNSFAMDLKTAGKCKFSDFKIRTKLNGLEDNMNELIVELKKLAEEMVKSYLADKDPKGKPYDDERLFAEAKQYSDIIVDEELDIDFENDILTPILDRIDEEKERYEEDLIDEKKPKEINYITSEMKKFIPKHQRDFLNEIRFKEHGEILYNLQEDYKKAKNTTDGQTAILHYFYGGSDWYIADIDGSSAFGYAVLNGDLQNAEYGYMSLDELVNNGEIELDFFWDERDLKELVKELQGGNIIVDLDDDYFDKEKPKPKKEVKKETQINQNDEFEKLYNYFANNGSFTSLDGEDLVVFLNKAERLKIGESIYLIKPLLNASTNNIINVIFTTLEKTSGDTYLAIPTQQSFPNMKADEIEKFVEANLETIFKDAKKGKGKYLYGFEDLVDEHWGTLYLSNPPKEKAKKEAKKDGIQDFGNKVKGARKDMWASYITKLDTLTDEELAIQPLAKILPPLRYDKMVSELNIPVETVAMLYIIRINLPQRPTFKPNSNTSRHKQRLQEWIENITIYQEIIKDVLQQKNKVSHLLEDFVSGEDKVEYWDTTNNKKSILHPDYIDDTTPHVKKHTFNLIRTVADISIHLGFPAIIPKSLKLYKIHKATPKYYYVTKGNYIMQTNITYPALLDWFEKLEVSANEKKGKKKAVKFQAYYGRDKNRRIDKSIIKIGKKLANGYDLVLVEHRTEDFNPISKIWEWVREHQEELEEQLSVATKNPPYRFKKNRERYGDDYRDGRAILPVEFQENFYLDGLIWGNWVNQTERQEYMNDIYDSLMDLATVLEIDPKAISYGGNLSMGVGSHGGGGSTASAMFHYPQNTISMTKTKGSGCFAHEWGHAFDYHYSMIESNGIFSVSMKWCSETKKGMKSAEESNLRPEIFYAFEEVRNAIAYNPIVARSKEIDNTSGKRGKYWSSDKELFARCFEWYVKVKLEKQDMINDFLVNIIPFEAYPSARPYPYPILGESQNLIKAFDMLIGAIEMEKTGDTFTLQGIDYAD